MAGRRVTVTVVIDAPTARVWRAICEPSEVRGWDGVEPLDVPAGYPRPGQHARWRLRVGLVPLVLHDRVARVEPESVLGARITVGFVDLDEMYTLRALDASRTELVSDNIVRPRWRAVPGLGALAARTTRANVTASMDALRRWCEGDARVVDAR
jgi:hypothetical protein